MNNLGSGPKLGQGSGSKNTLRQDPPRPCRWGWWGTAWCWWPPSGQPGILASPEQSGQWMHRRSWSTCRLTLEILWRMAWPFSQTFLLVKMSKLCIFFFFNYHHFYPLDLALAKRIRIWIIVQWANPPLSVIIRVSLIISMAVRYLLEVISLKPC